MIRGVWVRVAGMVCKKIDQNPPLNKLGPDFSFSFLLLPKLPGSLDPFRRDCIVYRTT